MLPLTALRRLALPLIVAGALTPFAARGEPVTVLDARQILPQSMLEGPNFWIDPEVRNDGLVNTYRVKTEYGTLKSKDGQTLYYSMIKPSGFSVMKKYPVYLSTYGGPHSQHVARAFGSSIGSARPFEYSLMRRALSAPSLSKMKTPVAYP